MCIDHRNVYGDNAVFLFADITGDSEFKQGGAARGYPLPVRMSSYLHVGVFRSKNYIKKSGFIHRVLNKKFYKFFSTNGL